MTHLKQLRKNFRLGLSAIFFLFGLSGFHFIPGEYEQIRSLNATLLSKFSADKHFFIGVGRSPTPLIAFLNAIGVENAKQIPLSQMMTYRRMSIQHPKTKQLMHAHLNEHLPKASELQGKKVVLIDFALQGQSLIEATQVIRDFYQKSVKVESVAFISKDQGTVVFDHLKSKQITTIPIDSDSIFYQKLHEQRYDEFSPVPQKLIWNTWSPPNLPNPEKVAEFQEAMISKTDADPTAKKLTQKTFTQCIRALMPF